MLEMGFDLLKNPSLLKNPNNRQEAVDDTRVLIGYELNMFAAWMRRKNTTIFRDEKGLPGTAVPRSLAVEAASRLVQRVYLTTLYERECDETLRRHPPPPLKEEPGFELQGRREAREARKLGVPYDEPEELVEAIAPQLEVYQR